MAENPNLSYSDIFKKPTQFPPLPGTSKWVPVSSIEEHRAYVQHEKTILQRAEMLVSRYQSYVDQSNLEPHREQKRLELKDVKANDKSKFTKPK